MRVRALILALPLLALLSPLPAAADAGEYRVAITPLAGYRLGGDISVESEATDGDQEVGIDDDTVYGFILNSPSQFLGGDNYTEWEFYYARQSVGIDDAPEGVDAGLELDITHYLVGGTYVGAGKTMRPYFAAGIGAAHLSPDLAGSESDTVFAFSFGGGAQLFPESRIGVRLEARALGSVIESDTAIFCRSGPEGSGCAFLTSGDVLWQWEVTAGLVARF